MAVDPANRDQYRIAVYTRLKDPQQLSDVFQQMLGIHPTDAAIWSHHVPGILNEDFPEELARKVTEAIRGIGLQASVIRREDIPNLHQAYPVHHARCEDHGFQIIDMNDQPETLIPWSAIQVVCIGEVPFEATRHYPPGTWSGISAGHHYQRPAIDTPLTPSLEAWITCQHPFPNLRFEHERINYEYLGSRLGENSTVNFRRFIQDLVDHASTALLTESTRAFLQHIQPEHYRFKSAEDLLQYATLHTLKVRESAAEKLAKPVV